MTATEQFRVMRTAVDGIEAVFADSALHFARHSHDTFGIGLIDRGGQTSASGRGVVEAMAGDTITVNPGEVHDGVPLGRTSRAWRMLYMAPDVVAKAAEDIFEGSARREEFHAPVLADRRVAGIVSTALSALLDGRAASLARDERLLLLLASVLRERTPVQASASAAVMRARERLDGDPAAVVSLETLAADCGLGRFRLIRDFARVTGLTPHAYRLQRRTELARRLIRRGSLLADAALEAGFADQSHMTRNFARRYGYTPGVYLAALG